MIFAVLDPSPLTVCINCSFFTFIRNKSGDLTDAENYRAIMIPDDITKLLEFVLYDKLLTGYCFILGGVPIWTYS